MKNTKRSVKPRRAIRKRLRFLRQWVANYAKVRNPAIRNQMLEDIEEGTFTSAKGIGIEFYGHCVGCESMVALFDGNANAWEEIDRSLLFYFWHARFQGAVAVEAIQRNDAIGYTKAYGSTAAMASVLCHTYASSQHDQHHAISEMWRLLVGTPGALDGTPDFWEGGSQGDLYYEAFCLRLFREGTTSPTWELPREVSERALGPFQGILDSWQGGEGLVSALENSLDYHCENLDSAVTEVSNVPFELAPFGLYPAWFLAVEKLRAEQGLDMPEVDHRLLKLPTANPAGYRFGTAKDPLFPMLADFYEKLGLP